MKRFIPIALLVLAPGFTFAQSNTQTVKPNDSNSTGTTDIRDNGSPHQWGWLGLIGLIGLAGLRRPKSEAARNFEAQGVNVKTAKF